MDANEKVEILRMLSEGKITATEAVELLEKLGDGAKGVPVTAAMTTDFTKELPQKEIGETEFPSPEPFKIKVNDDDLMTSGTYGKKPRWLKIRVSELNTGRQKVSISLPMGIVGFGLGIARRFGADFDDDGNIDDMWNMLKQGERGVLVDVEDEEDNEHVQIYLD